MQNARNPQALRALRKKFIKKAIVRLLAMALVVCALLIARTVYDNSRAAAAAVAQQEKPTLAEALGDGSSSDSGGRKVDFGTLRKQNVHVVAWLHIPKTQIDYPVAQATDNDYYLSHTARLEPSRYGSLFLDCRNHEDFSDFNNIVYGHNMRDGKMFGSLKQFGSEEFFNEVKTGTLQTPTRNYRLEFFAVLVTDPKSDVYNIAFAAPAMQDGHLAMLQQRHLYWRDIDIGYSDRILTLSTCANNLKDRVVVVAKIVPLP
ncbi:MAG: class B sortase [Oscillospiraceae bacterium]|jgi:sortase B|nr:class B sortase [Oscillospiraceae bacterium]